MAYGELFPYVRAVETVERQATIDKQLEAEVAALPAGVYIPLRELQSLVDEVNLVCGGEWPDGDGRAPMAINEAPKVSSLISALILEGFQALTRGARRRHSQSITGDHPLSARDQDRLDVQMISHRIRAENPKISIEAILRRKDFAGYRAQRALNTLRHWLSEVDTRDPASKPGRRHKTR